MKILKINYGDDDDDFDDGCVNGRDEHSDENNDDDNDNDDESNQQTASLLITYQLTHLRRWVMPRERSSSRKQ